MPYGMESTRRVKCSLIYVRQERKHRYRRNDDAREGNKKSLFSL
jgi:hypothetical protein